MKNKLIGKISNGIGSFYNLAYYQNYNIYLSLALKYHTSKHKKDFINNYSYYYTLNNLDKVLLNPEFIFYDHTKGSIRYFKKLKEYVCVVVKFQKDKAFVATFYPISKKNILKLKKLLICTGNMVK